MKKIVISRFLVFIWATLFSQNLLSAPLIVNIDNPEFRKTVTALPPFIVCPSLEEEKELALRYAEEGAKELTYLLGFTGLFNNIAPAAYKEPFEALTKKECQGSGPSFFGSKDVEHVSHWKSIGVESLTVGKVIGSKDGLVLEIRTMDVHRRQILLGKRYGNIDPLDFKKVMRRYANLLLEVYSGKPGIFSSKITFVGKKNPQSQKQIYISDFDGSNVTQITSANVPHLSPHWSPDNRYITYTSYEKGNPDLYLYDVETKKTKIISKYRGLNSGAQWAPSGKVLAYTGSKNGDSDIFYLNPFSGTRKRLIRGGGLDVDPTFSPDGKYLAFVSGRYGNPHIFLALLKWDTQQSLRVVKDTRLTFAGWYNSTPAWSPDSKRIVFAGYDKDINRYDVFIMDRDGKNLERLTLKTGDNESPSFSPNGQHVIFQSNRVGDRNIKGPYQLWRMMRDGSSQVKVETGLYEAQTPHWSQPGY